MRCVMKMLCDIMLTRYFELFQMAKCFPQQFIQGMTGGSLQNWIFTVPRRGLADDRCAVIITNETLQDQDIDLDSCGPEIDIRIPARIRNISVQLSDINYNVRRINLIRRRNDKLYFYAVGGGSFIMKG